MKKLIIITACVLTYATSTFAAKLPSVGYEGPYQVPDDEYGYSDDIYDNSGKSGSSNYISTAASETPQKAVCDEAVSGYPTEELLYCVSCAKEYLGLSAADGSSDCDILETINYPPTPPGLSDYLTCAASTCGIGSSGPDPCLNCPPGPIGVETPLVFFALSLLALRLWRIKKERCLTH